MWATLIGRRVVQGDSAALIFHHWPFVLCFLYFLCFLSFFLLDSFSVHSYVWSLSLCSVRIWTLNDWRFSLLEGFINEMNGLLLSSSFYSSCLFVFFSSSSFYFYGKFIFGMRCVYWTWHRVCPGIKIRFVLFPFFSSSSSSCLLFRFVFPSLFDSVRFFLWFFSCPKSLLCLGCRGGRDSFFIRPPAVDWTRELTETNHVRLVWQPEESRNVMKNFFFFFFRLVYIFLGGGGAG